MGIEVILASRATEMIEFIKDHLDLSNEQLEQICDIFLEDIKLTTFKAYE